MSEKHLVMWAVSRCLIKLSEWHQGDFLDKAEFE